MSTTIDYHQVDPIVDHPLADQDDSHDDFRLSIESFTPYQDEEGDRRGRWGRGDSYDPLAEPLKTTKSSMQWPCFWLALCVMGVWAVFVTGIVIYETRLLNERKLSKTRAIEQGNPTLDDDLAWYKGKNTYTYEDFMSFRYYANVKTVRWVGSEAHDGVMTFNGNDGVYIEFMGNGTKHRLVAHTELVDAEGYSLAYMPYELSADLGYMLIATHGRKQWRHSSLKEYVVFNLTSKAASLLTKSGKPKTTAYATWSPTGHSVMFVRDNNVFVSVDLKQERQVTFDGSDTVFNGVPDWIYEEEVYSTDFTCWWSPDSKRVAYLRLDETQVPVYQFPMFTDPGLPQESYPQMVSIKYPKPGYPNPIASIHVHDLNDAAPTNSTPVAGVKFPSSHDFEDTDRLLVEAAWMTNTDLFVRAMNRVQDTAHLWRVNKDKVTLVREESGMRDKENCWLDIRKSLKPIKGAKGEEGYVDIAIHKGYQHLAYFASLDAKEPTAWLTEGAWEVIDGALAIDSLHQWVYYMSTERGSTIRHLYRVNVNTKQKEALTPDDGGTYMAKFSHGAGYYWLSYTGPDIPWQKLMTTTTDKKYERVLEDNASLKLELKNVSMPILRHGTINVNGTEMNYEEIVPPNFDANNTKHYGVLFDVYGGPFSQKVDMAYKHDFHTAIASDPKQRMIVVRVDGRGSGFKGTAFRCAVRTRLGELEALDTVNAAKHWANLPYVDPTRIAVWGWSYGGYLTAKIVETDAHVFATAMSVAPVTDWRLYDTVYTERYMLTPQMNRAGYEKSAVRNMEGFKNTKFLLVHGTGDDNVHFHNTAQLLDLFTMSSIRGYRLQVFTDSDHSISRHGAHSEIYALLRDFLYDTMPLKNSTVPTLQPRSTRYKRVGM